MRPIAHSGSMCCMLFTPDITISITIPARHNHHHRWITLHFGSDSIDSRWRRWKSHGVNNKCSSNYSTRLTLFSICIINKSFYYNAQQQSQLNPDIALVWQLPRRMCRAYRGLRPSEFAGLSLESILHSIHICLYMHIVWSCKYILIQQAAHFART